MLKLLTEQFVDLHELNYEEGRPSFEIIRDLIQKKQRIPLCKELDSRGQETNIISRRLKKIIRREQFLFEERGAKDLYLGWPFVRGKFGDGTPVRCPLIFFPIAIEKQNNTWEMYRRKDVNITLNKSFLLAYAYYNQVSLDEELIETVIDDYERDDIAFRTQLYNLLKDSALEINFNQDNFTDELQPFQNFRKAEFEELEKNGQLKLYPEAVIGLFPQSGSYLVPDYMKLLESEKFNDIEEFLASRTIDEDQTTLFAEKINEENTFTPFPLDAYQEKALKEIKRGKSIVVQGPPGTGKSQLISNVICDFIARGRNVLLVCQKRAALDVVYERLKQKELHDFVALVHDFKNDRKPIYEQIDQQIEAVDHYEKKNAALDSIQLERTFSQASRRIDQLLEELQEFSENLFDESECGKSAKELYLTSSPDLPHFSMNLEYRSFHFNDMADQIRRFRQYFSYHHSFEKRVHFWSKGPSFAGFGSKEMTELLDALRSLPEFYQDLIERSKEVSSIPLEFDILEYFASKVPELQELIDELNEGPVFEIYKGYFTNKPTESINWLISTERTLLSCFKGFGIEASLQSSELGRFQEVLEDSIKARSRPWSWVRWYFSKEKTFLTRVLVANDLKSNKQGFKILLARVDNRLNFEHIVSEINSRPWLTDFPSERRKIDIQDWFYWQKKSLNIYSLADGIRSLHELVSTVNLNKPSYLNKLKSVKSLSLELPDQLDKVKHLMTIHQVKALLLGKESQARLEKLLRKDFDAICDYHQLKLGLSAEEQRTIDKILEHKLDSIDEIIDLFLNSLSLAWIDHIEGKYPDLRNVSSGKIERDAEELRTSIKQKRLTSKEILLLKAREKTYENLAFNRLNNRVTYRDLHHQVTKKRRIWPIRRVISEFSEELFSLLPCWMCSPESASAIFPMSEQFDLVIFDEASQCFSERGIPAMYRGKQLLITGDSKQLKPNDLYRVRWEEEDDTVAELSIDSLLDLMKHHLPEMSLAGHYRSKSLELIDFSNEHFYDHKLRLLPDYDYVNKKNSSIDYISVDGILEDGENAIEAQHVVDIAIDLIKSPEPYEVGIVTFNHKQRELILDLLEDQCQKEELIIPESLFVKNIENVQGDEKDVILFSIGYAPDKKGNVRLQFGSLNVDGGENRLNVAVTRAREKVIVVSSLHPSKMHTDDTKNDGPKLLKKYLEYAIDVSKGNWKPKIPNYDNHSIDWYLRNKLKEKTFYDVEGFQIEKELPFADLSVKRNKEYKGLILTDDERYFQALSPKQIYAFQHFHLSMKNWKNVRFHSREIWVDPDGVAEKMQKFLFKLQAD